MTFNKSYFLLMASAVALTGCQSASMIKSAQQDSAKLQLETAIKHHMRSAFSYHSQAYFGAQSPEKLAQSQTSVYDYYHCDNEHDDAYVRLARQALAEGLDISSDTYVSQRQQLKDDYLSCQQKFDSASDEASAGALEAQTASSDSGEEEASKQSSTATDALQDKSAQAPLELIEETRNPKPKDIAKAHKKSQVIQAYWTDPTQIGVKGTYQPLKQVVTALPYATYQANNLLVSVNQPIYINLKERALYLWADNVALANALWLDKKLGTAWQNKWLKIPLNDGSLPEGFADDLWQTYLKARQHSFAQSADNQYRYVKLNELTTNQNDTPISTLAQVPYIIEHQESLTQATQRRQAVYQQFYDEMVAKYPKLIKDGDESASKSPSINSQMIMQTVFALLNEKIQAMEASTKEDKLVTTYYGLSDSGLAWVYHERQTPLFDNNIVWQGVATTFDKKVSGSPFVRLPSAHQTPTAQNSIDVLAYSNTLMTQLKEGDDIFGKMIGRMLLGGLGALNNEYDDYPYDYEQEFEEPAIETEETAAIEAEEATATVE
ncbi:MAG: hypothetical protein Q4C68_02110 [Moraxella sp.]|nr:hypothetical protein [Moraxella sp.]